MSMKNSNDPIRNRTHDLSTCSAVPQPTGLSLAPSFTLGHSKIHRKKYKVILNSSFWLTYCCQYLETNYSDHILTMDIKLGIFAFGNSKIHMKWQHVIFNSGFWLIYGLENLATNYLDNNLSRVINLGMCTLRHSEIHMKWQHVIFNSGFWLTYGLQYLATNYTDNIILRDIKKLFVTGISLEIIYFSSW